MANLPHKKKKKLHGVIWDGLRLQLKIGGITGITLWVLIWLVARFYSGENSGDGLLARLHVIAQDTELVLFMLAGAAICLFTISFIFSFSYTSELKRSITHLIFQMKQVQRGSLDRRIQLNRKDEMTRLAGELNDMTDGYEQQIRSMHRLLNENSELIKEKELAAGLEERRRLARDLHDAVSQQLFAVSMNLGAIPRLIEEDPERSKQLIAQVEKMIHASQQELRALIMHLRPITLEGKGLKDALYFLFDELKEKNKQITFSCNSEQLPELDAGIEDQLFRIIQEALSNILRHAKANKVNFTVEPTASRLTMTISDNGIGFDQEAKKSDGRMSYGLTTMEERVKEAGGHFSILSYPNKGTTVKISIPLSVRGGV